MAATTLSPVRETWTIIERTPRTSGLLGSIHRELEPGVVARTTDGEFYKLVTLRRHLGREPGTLWNVEWVTQTGAPLRRTRAGMRLGIVEFKNASPTLGLRTMCLYAYKVAV